MSIFKVTKIMVSPYFKHNLQELLNLAHDQNFNSFSFDVFSKSKTLFRQNRCGGEQFLFNWPAIIATSRIVFTTTRI